MTIKVGINGFGRIGRLALRAAWGWPEFEFVQINDPAGDAATHAHLLNFDSVHGRWQHEASHAGECIVIDGKSIKVTANKAIADTDWSGCDLVIEASGKMKTVAVLSGYLEQGVKRVVVSAPVKEAGALNIVMGVNQDLFDPALHRIVTAASCTTNCLAPVVKVIHQHLGIRHGSITTIPDLKGRLNGLAVRVPLANASLTDCVFEVERATTVDEVNALLKAAADGPLKDILCFEERPLVSIDYRTDPRSSIIDALSTMVINGTQVKLYAWYDNEWAYANRTVELARLVGLAH